VKRAALAAVLVCVGVVAAPARLPSEATGRNVGPIGTIDLAGSVMQMKLDEAGTRLLIATVRYPEGGLQKNELHLHELTNAGAVVHRGTREISDAASVALAPSGEQLAVGCGGARVCIHEWGLGPAVKQFTVPGKAREVGALALRPDAGLLVAAQRPRMEILSWELKGDGHRAWAVASLGERLKEGVTPRLHGSPPWIARWVGVSPDGQRIASVRDDGVVSIWRRDGQAIKSLQLSHYSDVDPIFTADGAVFAIRAWNGRLSVVDVESERVVLAVDDSQVLRSVRRANLLAHGRYLAVSRAEGVVVHAIPSGMVTAVFPIPDHVWGTTTSGDGRVAALATQHRVTLWRVTPP
jgi:WD40 repeat protein